MTIPCFRNIRKKWTCWHLMMDLYGRLAPDPLAWHLSIPELEERPKKIRSTCRLEYISVKKLEIKLYKEPFWHRFMEWTEIKLKRVRKKLKRPLKFHRRNLKKRS